MSRDALISGSIFWLWIFLALYIFLSYPSDAVVHSLIVMAVSFAVNTFLKAVIKKERQIEEKSRKFYIGVQRYSMPSAHTQLAFTALALIIRWFEDMVLLALVLAIATAISRIVLGRHTLVEVAAGGIIGFCVGWL